MVKYTLTIMPNKKEDFQKKYTKSNRLERLIINNFYKSLAQISADLQVKSILELGSGHGYSTQYIKKYFPNALLEGSDLDPSLLIDAQKLNQGVIFSGQSIYDIKKPNNSFDLIICLEVLEHLEKPKKALEEIHRVSSDYCILSVPNEPLWRVLNILRGSYWSSLGNTPGHINHWGPKTFIKLAQQYFDIIAYKQPIPWTILLGRKK